MIAPGELVLPEGIEAVAEPVDLVAVVADGVRLDREVEGAVQHGAVRIGGRDHDSVVGAGSSGAPDVGQRGIPGAQPGRQVRLGEVDGVGADRAGRAELHGAGDVRIGQCGQRHRGDRAAAQLNGAARERDRDHERFGVPGAIRSVGHDAGRAGRGARIADRGPGQGHAARHRAVQRPGHVGTGQRDDLGAIGGCEAGAAERGG